MKWILCLSSVVFLVSCSVEKGEKVVPKTPSPKSHDQHAGSPSAKGEDSHAGHGMNNDRSTLSIKTEPAEVEPGAPTMLRLMIHDMHGSMVKDFETLHERKVHLIIVREGLDHFAHIHPEIDAHGEMTATFTFPVGGKYYLYADHKPAGKSEMVALGDVQVPGKSEPAPELVPNVPGKAAGDGLNAEISVKNVKAGSEAHVSFVVLDPEDKPVLNLQPYLGAMGHLVILSADAQQFVHAHPMDAKADDGRVNFMAHFMKPGIFKGWGQFQREGSVYTVPFVINVE